MSDLREDWRANSDVIARAVLTIYRYGRLGHRCPFGLRQLVLLPYVVLNLFVVRLLCGVDLPRRAQVGPGLRLEHGGRGLAVHPGVVIGARVTLFHGVSIGQARAGELELAPVIGDDVMVWPYAIIAGDVFVGDGAEIGAHAVVLSNMLPGARALAARATIIDAAPAPRASVES